MILYWLLKYNIIWTLFPFIAEHKIFKTNSFLPIAHDMTRSVHWITVRSVKVLVIRTASSCIAMEHYCLTYDGPWLSCLEQFEKIIVMPAKNELTVELSTLICHSDILHGPSPPCKQCHQFISKPSTRPSLGRNMQHSTFCILYVCQKWHSPFPCSCIAWFICENEDDKYNLSCI